LRKTAPRTGRLAEGAQSRSFPVSLESAEAHAPTAGFDSGIF
jgi:hypothetical protein